MQDIIFLKGYQDHVLLRKSFNQLAESIFGIEFETWFKQGYWTEKYQPYSFVHQDKIVANVSVNLITLVIHNERKIAVQIGTVMTHPDYRNKSLSRRLMEKVLADFQHVDIFYLFANQSVLDFYPKFGFQAIQEVQYSMDYHVGLSAPSYLRKLDGRKPEDLAFIYSLAANRVPISKMFGTVGTEELLMFYSIMVFPQDLYYLEEEQAVVIFKMEADVLHLFDVVSRHAIRMKDILGKIADERIKKVVFHFHPDDSDASFYKENDQSSNVLFIKNLTNVSLPLVFKHPQTSQA